MYWLGFGSICEGSSDGQTCRIVNNHEDDMRPIEIYIYIDPVHPESWSLDGIIKKLIIEYGRYFTIKYVICITQNTMDLAAGRKNSGHTSGKVASLTVIKDNELLSDDNLSPYKAAIAVKTAELQGKVAGIRFLHHLYEQLCIDSENIMSNRVLLDCAALAKLDVQEFKRDFVSKSPINALICDQKLTAEMDVESCPTMVLFNVRDDKEGIKVTGNYPYDVYVQILTEALGKKPSASEPPELLDFMKRFRFVETKEIALIYNMNEQETVREMKKLKLKQLVEPYSLKSKQFWRYVGA
ncbi:MAG: DsbA family protein [Tuberibacillus sp.]